MPPATIHKSMAIPGLGTALSTSAGTMKIEGPIVPLITSMIESKR